MKLLGGFFALAILSTFGTQAVVLPAHDSQHSLTQARQHAERIPAITSSQCDLCVAYATGRAAIPIHPGLEIQRLPLVSSPDFSLHACADSALLLVSEARGPPAAA